MFNAEEAKIARTLLSNHNLYIIWKPEYNLGLPIIDEQHRGVVTIINSLQFGILHNYVSEMLLPIVEMIFDYTKIHFQIEEDFLEKLKFPNIVKHKELHVELIAKLKKTGKRSLLERDPNQFLDFLKEWWIGHICNEDQLYRDYILSSQKGA